MPVRNHNFLPESGECGEAKLTRESLATHLTSCPEGLAKCAHGCGETVVRKLQAQHEAQTCELFPVACAYCAGQPVRRGMAAHLSTRALAPVACSWCPRTPRRQSLAAHEGCCEEAELACRLQCGELVPVLGGQASFTLGALNPLTVTAWVNVAKESPMFRRLAVVASEPSSPARPTLCPEAQSRIHCKDV